MKAVKRSTQNLKSSGIEWIGAIPVEHDIVRNKYLIKFIKGKIPKNQNKEHKGIPYVGASDLDNFEYSMYTEDTDLPMCIKDDVLILWDGARAGAVVLCQDLVQHKMRNFNYFQLTNSDSLATLAL